MSAPADRFAIRRILVALDASPHSLAALNMAADLAARMQAELAGLFVEDVELLKMAESPSVREIGYSGAAPTALNRAAMERRMKAQSEQIRHAIAAAAHRAQVRWSFHTVRGKVTAALQAAATEHDIVAVGRLGWSVGRPVRIGSTALELATSSIPLLFISQQAALGRLRPLTYYDGSPGSQNALLVAANLASAGVKGVTVLLSADNYEHKSAEIKNRLHGRPLDLRCCRVDLAHKASILRAVKQEHEILLVLASRQVFQAPEALEALLRETNAPLLLLGDGFEREVIAATSHP